jgi:hypothetical protein
MPRLLRTELLAWATPSTHSGTPSTHRGYSEYSQRCARVLPWVLRVLTGVLQSAHSGARLRPMPCLLRTELLELERLELQLVPELRALRSGRAGGGTRAKQ